ncbi:LuxR C-terminal-related transcriptional regulator [Streptomyces sp. Ru73]|uniref:LuxR C-terminal-related transcriptional regulator n=1 Tax=Streptomyces sp. Ru73 TaxID=2080748 RepID=UPI0015E2F678|nr:LuxR C-terminal-related transcriptional regulator [Streptomyces sp. Ru73]
MSTGTHADLVGLLDRRAALREAARRARVLAGADIGLAGQVERGGTAVMRFWAGTRHDGLHGLVIPAGSGVGGKVLATGEVCRVRDYARSRVITHDFDGPVGAEGVRAMLGVPVVHAGELLGVVSVARRGGAGFTAAETAALSGLADAVAVALTVADRVHAERAAEAAAERRRIAESLHDSVGALLATLGAQVRDLRTGYAAEPGLAARLGGVERQLAEAGVALRRSLRKDAATADLAAALREVAAAGHASGPRLPAPDGAELLRRRKEAGLTRREHEVLRQAALGRTNPEIAAELDLARNTVKTYLQSALHKLGARNRVEAIARAGEAGLL